MTFSICIVVNLLLHGMFLPDADNRGFSQFPVLLLSLSLLPSIYISSLGRWIAVSLLSSVCPVTVKFSKPLLYALWIKYFSCKQPQEYKYDIKKKKWEFYFKWRKKTKTYQRYVENIVMFYILIHLTLLFPKDLFINIYDCCNPSWRKYFVFK